MARGPALGASALDVDTINLTRLLSRLQKTLLDPDLDTEQRLRTSGYERRKVRTNLEYARALLLRLEQDSAAIKIQQRKQNVQTDLLAKRDVIQQLAERLAELEAMRYEAEADVDAASSDGEDLLAQDTPSDDLNDNDTPPEPLSRSTSDHPLDATSASANASRDALFPSTLRARHARIDHRDGAASSPRSTATTTAITETLLAHNRTEQESLTTSLLDMAQALKTSSLAVSSALDADADVLARATGGLDRNKGSLDATQKKMGYLRSLTEGRGWWGRVLMYVWIFVLMFIALFIVAFLPKLRF